jgi:hypothetical protein
MVDFTGVVEMVTGLNTSDSHMSYYICKWNLLLNELPLFRTLGILGPVFGKDLVLRRHAH